MNLSVAQAIQSHLDAIKVMRERAAQRALDEQLPGAFELRMALAPGVDQIPAPTVSTAERINQIMDEAFDLFVRKNEQYGNAIETTGVLGAVVAATGDIARLRRMVLQEDSEVPADSDNVRDKFMDILVQAAIGIYMVDTGNWRGK